MPKVFVQPQLTDPYSGLQNPGYDAGALDAGARTEDILPDSTERWRAI